MGEGAPDELRWGMGVLQVIIVGPSGSLDKAPSGLDVVLHDTPGHDQNMLTKKEDTCAQTTCMIEKEAWVSDGNDDEDDEQHELQKPDGIESHPDTLDYRGEITYSVAF